MSNISKTELFQSKNNSGNVVENFSSVKFRVFNSISLIFFSIVFYDVYEQYISSEWDYTGLVFNQLDSSYRILITAVFFIQGWIMPTHLTRPSSIIVWMLTILILVPSLILTPMIGAREPSQYYVELGVLALSFIFISIFIPNNAIGLNFPMPPAKFFYNSSIFFVLLSIFLAIYYIDILNFVSIDEVYNQRNAANDAREFSVIGYVRTYYLYVFSPILIAAGLLVRRYIVLFILGYAGCILTYMIDASKIAFVIPMLMASVWIVLRYFNGQVWVLTFGIALLSALSGLLSGISGAAKIFADLVLFRSIAIPGQTFSQYSDVFHSLGYTWWSNVTGFGLVITPPAALASDPLWPRLGGIVGAIYFGDKRGVNLNANLFVGEGVAAAGALGILVISVVFIGWLRLLDHLSTGCNRSFVILIIVPIGMALSNVHLSTALVSFGAGFWLIALFLLRRAYFPERT